MACCLREPLILYPIISNFRKNFVQIAYTDNIIFFYKNFCIKILRRLGGTVQPFKYRKTAYSFHISLFICWLFYFYKNRLNSVKHRSSKFQSLFSPLIGYINSKILIDKKAITVYCEN